MLLGYGTERRGFYPPQHKSLLKLYFLYELTRELLVTDLVILNLGQMTRMTPALDLFSPNYHIIPPGAFGSRTDFTCINPSIRWVFSGTRIPTYDTPTTSL
ncbi:hypothetical protein TNCV_994801 [Trichonephila clavipes]|nr:hypothetical protein TNCV_994801 [Trichonephila clavipes]